MSDDRVDYKNQNGLFFKIEEVSGKDETGDSAAPQVPSTNCSCHSKFSCNQCSCYSEAYCSSTPDNKNSENDRVENDDKPIFKI